MTGDRKGIGCQGFTMKEHEEITFWGMMNMLVKTDANMGEFDCL